MTVGMTVVRPLKQQANEDRKHATQALVQTIRERASTAASATSFETSTSATARLPTSPLHAAHTPPYTSPHTSPRSTLLQYTAAALTSSSNNSSSSTTAYAAIAHAQSQAGE